MERQIVEYTKRTTAQEVTVMSSPLNPTDAYLIGRVAADGSYTYNEKKKFPRMGITAKDVPLLQKIVERYVPNTHVLSRDGRNITINNGIKDYHYITEGHGELHFPINFTRQLFKHGIVCKKADRVLAGIPKHLYSCAILGFVDGDGSIVVRFRKDCRTPRLNIHIVTSCRLIATHLQRHLENELSIGSSIYTRDGSQKYLELRINNTESSIKFCKWIYSNLPEIYCEKKKGVFDRYMKSCVRSGELLESENQSAAKPTMLEGSETTGIPEVASHGEKAPDTLTSEDIVQIEDEVPRLL